MPASLEHRLNRKLDVYRRAQMPDGSGGKRTAWAYAGTVRAMVSQPRAGEQTTADQAAGIHYHRVYLGPRADVRRGDRLRDHVAEPELVDADARPYHRVESVVEPSQPGDYRCARTERVEAEGVE